MVVLRQALGRRWGLAIGAVVASLVYCAGLGAQDSGSGDTQDMKAGEEQASLVQRARDTLEYFVTRSSDAAAARFALAQADGVLIIAENGLSSGVAGWRGLLFGRDFDGSWTGPAIYTVISGTFGRTPTSQIKRAMFIVQSDTERLIAQRIRVGGSGVSVGAIAHGALPETDLIAVSDSKDGDDAPMVSFAGTVFSPDQYATNALYGGPLTIREAVQSTAYIGEDIAELRRRLAVAATGR